MFLLRLFYYGGKAFGKLCHLHVPSFILDPATHVFVPQYLCSLCASAIGSRTWVTVIGMNCCYFPGVPGLQCWAVTGCCWGLSAAELKGTRCQPWLPSPSRGMFGSLAHQASSVCIKCHIKTLGLWLHFQFLGLRKLLASRGQETRNFRVTGSKALSCVCILI